MPPPDPVVRLLIPLERTPQVSDRFVVRVKGFQGLEGRPQAFSGCLLADTIERTRGFWKRKRGIQGEVREEAQGCIQLLLTDQGGVLSAKPLSPQALEDRLLLSGFVFNLFGGLFFFLGALQNFGVFGFGDPDFPTLCSLLGAYTRGDLSLFLVANGFAGQAGNRGSALGACTGAQGVALPRTG